MLTKDGSVAAFVMRSGLFQPLLPAHARRDLVTSHIERITDVNAATALYPAQPSPTTSAVSQTVTAVPPQPMQVPPALMPHAPSDRHSWHTHQRRRHPAVEQIKQLHPTASLRGADPVELGEWKGRPLAKFEINQAADPQTASAQADALRRAANALRSSRLAHLPAELVGGPLAALLRGGAVELHFQNGTVIRTAAG